jgi:hypothetical protein
VNIEVASTTDVTVEETAGVDAIEPAAMCLPGAGLEREVATLERPRWKLPGVRLPGAATPAIVRLWENACAEFMPFLDFDTEICRVVCLPNAIESVNARICCAVKARGRFPNEQGALK